MSERKKSMASIVCLLYLFSSVSFAYSAQVDPQRISETVKLETGGQKTADLTRLINETLALNNKTLLANSDHNLPSQQETSSNKDNDWTFERVEYDLMEFLQDLGARYQQLKRETDDQSTSSALNDDQSKLEAKKVTPGGLPSGETAARTTDGPKLATYTATIASTTEISTSLASDVDHDIAESKWQYGIFDRFTRARASTTTTTTTSDPNFDSPEKFDVRQFNSDECGLRTYDDRDRVYLEAEAPENKEASKDLNQRRQRPNLNLLAHKKYQFQTVSSDVIDQEVASSGPSIAANWANKVEKDAYDSYKHQQQQKSNLPSLLDRIPNLGADQAGANDSEFNLASRRQWLQQQLGNTLQLLGFNGSVQSVAEYLNQTSGLSLNSRENMMKKSSLSKLGKSLASTGQQRQREEQDGQVTRRQNIMEQPVSSLSARQDELKLEARVIGGSDARLGDSPWSVSLQALVSRPGTNGVEYRHYCGGTIISEYYVLTAAHCLDFMVGRESRLFVVIGDLNWRMSTISVYGRRFGIEKLIIHGGYKSTAFGHDIGLIRTKESMKPLKNNGRYIVNSVCLPERGVEHSGEAELVGWGLFSNRNEMADSLQIADVPILPRPLCVDLYKRRTGLIQWLIGIELITDKQICAGTFGRGICQGDSGSALVFNQKVNNVRNKQAKSIHELSSDDDDDGSVVSRKVDSGQKQLAVGSGPIASAAAAAATTTTDADDQKQEGIVGKGILRNSYEHREQLQSRATIIGIVAFGGIRRCSYQSLPGVYMQTSKYMDWILPRIQSS